MAKLPKKIMLEADYEDGTTMWRIPCDCHDPEHDARLWFELDEDGFPSLKISTEVGFYHYKRYDDDNLLERFRDWRERIWKRITIVSKMLFTGYYTMEGEVILNEESIAAFQYALTEGNKGMLKAREKSIREHKEKYGTKE